MDKYLIVTIEDGGRIRDYRMTAEDAGRVDKALEGECQVNLIHVSDVPIKTADEVIKEWTE